MNEENLQGQNVNMAPEDVRAALGYSTNIMSQMMPVDMPTTAPTTAPQPQGEANSGDVVEDAETEKEDKVGELKAEMEGFKVEVKILIEQQIEGLRQDIKDALTENE